MGTLTGAGSAVFRLSSAPGPEPLWIKVSCEKATSDTPFIARFLDEGDIGPVGSTPTHLIECKASPYREICSGIVPPGEVRLVIVKAPGPWELQVSSSDPSW